MTHRIGRRAFLGTVAAATAAAPFAPAQAQNRPNIVLFVSDDHDAYYTGCYGNTQVRTPNIDRLAREGMLFRRAYCATAMCAPSRSTLYTGLFPHRHGGDQNHSTVRDGIQSLPHYLGPLGYRVLLAGKTHIKPEAAFPFEYLAFEDAIPFLESPPDAPYCIAICSRQPHTPHETGGYTPDEITLPPRYVDTPEMRQRVADYCTDIDLLDDEIGAVLDALDRTGQARDTLFIYTSDHGAPLPFGKWTCYESGLNVPFVMRWHDRVSPGTQSHALVSLADVLSTLIEAAGGTPPDDIDGRSFMPVLDGHDAHRNIIFGTHTNEGIRNGGPYPIRSACDARYKYIVNLMPDAQFRNNITEGAEAFGDLWESWLRAGEADSAIGARVRRYQHRPAVEFYDLQADPYELDNLAESPALEHQERIAALRQALAQWMHQQNDPWKDKLAEV